MELTELIRWHDMRLEQASRGAVPPVPGTGVRRRRLFVLRLAFVNVALLVLLAVGCWQLISRLDKSRPDPDRMAEARLIQPFQVASGPGLAAAYMEALQWAD
jgi:hypothetical protein